jgi:hypothetical protein
MDSFFLVLLDFDDVFGMTKRYVFFGIVSVSRRFTALNGT